MFNKKFDEKYPNVRKPIICNGLKEIKPYRIQEEEQNEEEEEEENGLDEP